MKLVAILIVCLGLAGCLHDPPHFAMEEPEERPGLRQPGAW
jgi:hypothetical protein